MKTRSLGRQILLNAEKVGDATIDSNSDTVVFTVLKHGYAKLKIKNSLESYPHSDYTKGLEDFY